MSTVATGRPTVAGLLLGETRARVTAFVRTPIAAFFTLVFPLVVLLLVGTLVGNAVLESRSGVRIAQFFTPAIAAYAAATAAYTSLAIGLSIDREKGVLRRQRALPIPTAALLGGRVGAGVVSGTAAVVLMVVAGVLFLDVRIVWAKLPAAVLALVVGIGCFAALGFAVSSIARTSAATQAITNGTLVPLAFVSDVFVVGYGDSNVGGSGTKRWGETVIVSTFGATAQIGAQGTGVTTCQGDSGGTAYLPMEDGSYRAISMVSTGLPGCNDTTGTHALMHPAIPWIEETSQIDITPCHDADGTWNPNPNCTGFFAGGSTPSGVWENMCEGTPSTGPSSTCGSAFDETPDNDPPEVTVANPTQGEEFDTGALVTIEIDAVDAGYGVEEVWIEIDGMEQAVRETYPPYAFADVPFPDGVYTIVAHAVDWAGNEGVSEPVTIGINAEVPDQPDPTTGADTDDTNGDSTGDVDPTDPGDGSSSDTNDAETSGTPDASGDGGDEGCGCSTPTPSPWAPLAALFVLFGLRRRPQR